MARNQPTARNNPTDPQHRGKSQWS